MTELAVVSRFDWKKLGAVVGVIGLLSSIGGAFIGRLWDAGRWTEGIDRSFSQVQLSLTALTDAIVDLRQQLAEVPKLTSRVGLLEFRADAADRQWTRVENKLDEALRNRGTNRADRGGEFPGGP